MTARPKGPKRPKEESPAELAFDTHWRRHAPPQWRDVWVKQVQAIPGRLFTFDRGALEYGLLVEIDGGVWLRKGGHTSGKGFTRDREKDMLALSHGLTVVRFTPQQLAADPVGIVALLVAQLERPRP